MNYQRIYNQFIADRRTKEDALIQSGEYKERHHIIPKSLEGTDEPSNLIYLTAGDHYFAHLVLAYCHGGSQWNSILIMMERRSRKGASWGKERRSFDFAKRQYSKYRKTLTGLNASNYDKTIYQFEHEDGQKISGTRVELCEKTGLVLKSLQPLFQDNKLPVHGWFRPEVMDKESFGQNKGNDHFQSDKKLYKFENINGSKLTGTRHDLINLSGMSVFSASKLICGRRKSIRGWFLSDKFNSEQVGRVSIGKKVINVNTGEIYRTLHAAALSINKKNGGSIGRVCNGKAKHAGGFTWQYV